MARSHKIELGGRQCQARSGQRILDAALVGGLDIPHDCRAGRCGACLLRVRAGITLGGQGRQPGMIHACQAMVFSDLQLEAEPTPPVVQVATRVSHVVEIAEDIVEVSFEGGAEIGALPGQYCKFRFRGFPDRPFSPTALLPTSPDSALRLHVKRVRGGRVTPFLGNRIARGHAVSIEGPYGHAYLRPGLDRRLVLIGSGTGFAPIWSLAAAALMENPHRPLILLANSRKRAAYYMEPALAWAATYPNVQVIAAVEDAAPGEIPFDASGNNDIPPIGPRDIVYAAGGPTLVDAVAGLALNAGAEFHADPFEVTGAQPPAWSGWMERARAWLAAG